MSGWQSPHPHGSARVWQERSADGSARGWQERSAETAAVRFQKIKETVPRYLGGINSKVAYMERRLMERNFRPQECMWRIQDVVVTQEEGGSVKRLFDMIDDALIFLMRQWCDMVRCEFGLGDNPDAVIGSLRSGLAFLLEFSISKAAPLKENLIHRDFGSRPQDARYKRRIFYQLLVNVARFAEKSIPRGYYQEFDAVNPWRGITPEFVLLVSNGRKVRPQDCPSFAQAPGLPRARVVRQMSSDLRRSQCRSDMQWRWLL